MYRLLNFLFGWDYIYWQNSADQGIARVRLDAYGEPFYFRYKNINLIDKIYSRKEWGTQKIIWLTCKEEKYLKDNKNV